MARRCGPLALPVRPHADAEAGIDRHALADAAKRAVGLGDKRPIEILEIRPCAELRGGAFSGRSSRALRREYIAAGRTAAEAALERLATVAKAF